MVFLQVFPSSFSLGVTAMHRVPLLFALALCALLLLPLNSSADVVFNNFGYGFETGDFPSSNAGDVLATAGVVTSLLPGINCDLSTNELTWVIKDLVSNGQFTPDGGKTLIISYSGGSIGLYCDPSNNHDWGINPPNATSLSTFEDGTQLLIGGFTQFVMFYDTEFQIGAFSGLINFTNGPDLVNLPSPNGMIFAGTIGPALDPNIPDGYALEIVGSITAPELCTVSGSVEIGCPGAGVEGVTVDLVDGAGTIHMTLTDENGDYVFFDVAAGDLVVSIVLPLGYAALSPTIVNGQCAAGDDAVVDFCLEQTPTEDEKRTIGFWNHQVNNALSGKQTGVQVPAAELLGYFDAIHDRFDPYFGIFVPVVTLQDFKDVLSVPGDNSDMLEKATQQFAGLLLNLVSNRCHTADVISMDGATVSQAITYISELIGDGDPSNDEVAKDIADTLNNGGIIGPGIIPLSTVQIAYSNFNAPKAGISNVNNYPNPLNPSTTISYELGSAATVSITIYNVRGQRVRTLVSSTVQTGINSVGWDGRDDQGRALASGVYFYHLKAGDNVVNRRMTLIR